MPVSRANKMQKYASAISNTSRTLLGKNLSRALSNAAVDQVNNPLPSYRKGGKVRRTGLARMHKGEMVIPAAKVKMLKKLLGA